jgi:transposase
MARGRKSSLVVLLTATKRTELEALQRRTTISAGLARRARMVLLRADGASLVDVARRVEVAPRVVAKWIKRYRQQGLRGLGDKARPGRPPGFSPRSGGASRPVGL